MTEDEALAAARRLLRESRRVLVLAGAGLSRESGIPTFRGEDGLWRRFRPEELATPGAFARMPEQVWDWYRWRWERVREARPHAGHRALARLAMCRRTTVANQNVDGLLEEAYAAAGADGRGVMAVHGTLRRAHCQRCGASREMGELPAAGVPACSCGGRLRPSVVWFGEELDPLHLARLAEEGEEADLALAVGTSALVWPAAGVLPRVRRRGRTVVVVNPDRDAAGPGDLWLEGGAARLLPALVEDLDGEDA